MFKFKALHDDVMHVNAITMAVFETHRRYTQVSHKP